MLVVIALALSNVLLCTLLWPVQGSVPYVDGRPNKLHLVLRRKILVPLEEVWLELACWLSKRSLVPRYQK